MRKVKLVFATLLALTSLSLFSVPIYAQESNLADRGVYVYDEANALSLDSKVALNSYLFSLDNRTDYELVVFFAASEMNRQTMSDWFNIHGVGKGELNNGTALFVLPDGMIFLMMGSGNEKPFISIAQERGEEIFKDFESDPVLTLLSFSSAIGGRINEASAYNSSQGFGHSVLANLGLILSLATAICLGIFLLFLRGGSSVGGSMVVPCILLFVFGMIIGISASTANSGKNEYHTYGVVTSVSHDSVAYEHSHPGTCYTTGGKYPTTICNPPWYENHVDYINEVEILDYEFNRHEYRFITTDHDGAWAHDISHEYKLLLDIETDSLKNLEYAGNNNSGGQTSGEMITLVRDAR